MVLCLPENPGALRTRGPKTMARTIAHKDFQLHLPSLSNSVLDSDPSFHLPERSLATSLCSPLRPVTARSLSGAKLILGAVCSVPF